MVNDLPDISDFFNDDKKSSKTENGEKAPDLNPELVENEIYIYISKGDNKWISASFIDVAPSNIGIHVILPIEIEFKYDEMSNFRLKFEMKENNKNKIMKEIPILVRWQEKDQISGRMKLGLHFPGDTKNEPDIIEILNILKGKK
jgi:hypothetical protein